MSLIENRSFFISYGWKDEQFPVEGVRDFIKWSNKNKEICRGYEFSEGHSFPSYVREEAYSFIKERL